MGGVLSHSRKPWLWAACSSIEAGQSHTRSHTQSHDTPAAMGVPQTTLGYAGDVIMAMKSSETSWSTPAPQNSSPSSTHL